MEEWKINQNKNVFYLLLYYIKSSLSFQLITGEYIKQDQHLNMVKDLIRVMFKIEILKGILRADLEAALQVLLILF